MLFQENRKTDLFTYELEFASIYERVKQRSVRRWPGAAKTKLLEYSTADKLFGSELDQGFWKTDT